MHNKIILPLFLLLSSAFTAWAQCDPVNFPNGGGTCPVPNPTSANVQAAINTAVDGDIVALGTTPADWTSKVTIPDTKAITLQGTASPPSPSVPGAGNIQTIITDKCSGPFLSVSARHLPLPAKAKQNRGAITAGDKITRVTGIDFEIGQGTNPGSNHDAAFFTNSGAGDNRTDGWIQWDNCIISNNATTNTLVKNITEQSIAGVFSHITFNKQELRPFDVAWNGVTNSDGSFAELPNTGDMATGTWGSLEWLVIEDCVMNGVPAGQTYAWCDSYFGGRLVMRYNDFLHCSPSTHGTESGGARGRGVVALDVYNNTFTGTPPDPTNVLTLVRSGAVRYHDNNLINWNSGNLVLQTYRMFYMWYNSGFGGADGRNPLDVNDTTDQTGKGFGGGPNGIYASGTADKTVPTVTSGQTVQTKVTGSPGWPTDHWKGYTLRHPVPSTAAQSGQTQTFSVITGNGPDTLNYPHSFGPGGLEDMTFAVRVYQARGGAKLAINNGASGYLAGATQMTVNGFAGVLINGTTFTVAGDTPTHTITGHSETSGATTSITFTPALASAVLKLAVINITSYAAGSNSMFINSYIGAVANGAPFTIVGETGLPSHSVTGHSEDNGNTSHIIFTPALASAVVSGQAPYPGVTTPAGAIVTFGGSPAVYNYEIGRVIYPADGVGRLGGSITGSAPLNVHFAQNGGVNDQVTVPSYEWANSKSGIAAFITFSNSGQDQTEPLTGPSPVAVHASPPPADHYAMQPHPHPLIEPTGPIISSVGTTSFTIGLTPNCTTKLNCFDITTTGFTGAAPTITKTVTSVPAGATAGAMPTNVTFTGATPSAGMARITGSGTGAIAGDYKLTIHATNGSETAPDQVFNLTMQGNTPPVTQITTPANGAVFLTTDSITVTATASDADGQNDLTQVRIFDGPSTVLQTCSLPATPCTYTSTFAAGAHSLTSKATDNAGAITTSSARAITVNAPNPAPTPPAAVIISP